jgi:hypothetical protein
MKNKLAITILVLLGLSLFVFTYFINVMLFYSLLITIGLAVLLVWCIYQLSI